MTESTPRRTVAVQERLRDQVARSLRADLLAGVLRPGGVYSAPVLAGRYGVSATPVREAMLDLAREGLVEVVRNKGFRITQLSLQDLEEAAEVRRLIEVPTVGRIARTASPDELRRLRPVAEEGVAAADSHDLLRYLDADRRFHLDLLALAGNRRLVTVVDEQWSRSWLRDPVARQGRDELRAAAREHLVLLDLLAVGDAEAAERCAARHLAGRGTAR